MIKLCILEAVEAADLASQYRIRQLCFEFMEAKWLAQFGQTFSSNIAIPYRWPFRFSFRKSSVPPHALIY